MAIELKKDVHDRAVQSIERYFEQTQGERIGNMTAAALLGFFLKEIGPSLYNQGVADAQARLHERLQELDYEVHEDEFGYWNKASSKRESRG
ncbi:DUF2164 domain-containing protein [Comamonas sp. MYb69]|uniref:DUF2164 domain-containing protein n=1 Tax=Comamonas sp. MYb69 TaxID=1848650 RepID=UPI0030988150